MKSVWQRQQFSSRTSGSHGGLAGWVDQVFVLLFIAVMLVSFSNAVHAQSFAPDPEKQRFEEEYAQRLRQKLQSDLNQYCPDGCKILGVDVKGREVFDTSSANLGFDTLTATARSFVVSQAVAELLIDNRLGSTNIERIQDVLQRSSRRYGAPVELEFTRATLPDSPEVVRAEAEARNQALELVRSNLEKMVGDYCALECRLQSVEVKTVKVPLEDAQPSLSRKSVVIRDSKLALIVSGVSAELLVDSEMDVQRRAQIENVFREHLEVYDQGVLNVRLMAMPKPATEIQKDADERRADPWGLERLGSALRIFREFANTKEIIRERDSLSRETEKERNRESVNERNSSSRESAQSETKTESEKSRTQSGIENLWSQEKVLLVAGLIGLLLLVAALGLRFVLGGKQVQHLISEGRSGQPQASVFGDEVSAEIPSSEHVLRDEHSSGALGAGQSHIASGRVRAVQSVLGGVSDEVAARMNIQALRDELTQMFISQPKVARDVFARVLREDGIEFSAKCVAVLGEILVFDLMGDDDVKKEVALLAEYIHVNAPVVGDSEQLSVLRNLKLKMTAGKMRQMTQKTRDFFDFMKAYSARQIYDLISDESPRSQAVVLTQLTTEKRRAVFELFEGHLKSDLLKELCVKEPLSRDYLFNVAQALRKKIERLGSADGEMLGGADVIIDLMERGDRDSQAEMMTNLDRTNPELARQVRSRFVSVETLFCLSDGLLLEIFLALEPHVMVTFLAGTRDKVRQLILSKAPDEVADDWNASAGQLRGIDGETFRLAEMQVLSKIRSFASGGLINLNEINEVIYPRAVPMESETVSQDNIRKFKISSPIVA